MAEISDVMTGVPHAIASSIGMPKLSLSEGYRKANAPEKTAGRSVFFIYPGKRKYVNIS